MLPHTLPQILSIIKAKAHNEKVKKSEFIAAFYLYSILLVHNAVVDSGFYVSVGSIHPVPKIRGGLAWVPEVFSGLGSFIKP